MSCILCVVEPIASDYEGFIGRRLRRRARSPQLHQERSVIGPLLIVGLPCLLVTNKPFLDSDVRLRNLENGVHGVRLEAFPPLHFEAENMIRMLCRVTRSVLFYHFDWQCLAT